MKTRKVFYQLLSCFFFSLLGLQIKFIYLSYSIETIVFYRSFLGAIIMIFFFIIFKKDKKKSLLNKNLKFHFLRSIFGVFAMYFGYKALTLISLSLATTIGFTKVFFTTIFSSIILKESLNLKKIFLIFVGFLGVYLIALPSSFSEIDGLVLALASALFVSGGIISVSYLTKKDNTINILMFHSIISSILIFLFFYEKIIFNINNNIFQVILMTLTALVGQFFNTESYRDEKAGLIIITSYSRIIFSTILGFLFLEEKISNISLIGIMIIIGTTFFVKQGSLKKD